jgi:hypothetical protein
MRAATKTEGRGRAKRKGLLLAGNRPDQLFTSNPLLSPEHRADRPLKSVPIFRTILLLISEPDFTSGGQWAGKRFCPLVYQTRFSELIIAPIGAEIKLFLNFGNFSFRVLILKGLPSDFDAAHALFTTLR